jgi:hypothetical protein
MPQTSGRNKAPSADKKTTLNLVYLKGEIVDGDFAKFDKVTAKLPKGTVVILSSPGGLVVEGLNIGIHIRRQGFRTMVTDECASMCALAWLAGVERAVSSNAHVGFHSVYDVRTGKIEKGSGNALVGAYLYSLGFSWEAIIELTSAKPDDMNWMTGEKATKLGIQAYVINEKKKM